MNPFFFGDSHRQLYGVYHPPAGQPMRSEGVLLCYPFGQEYMRAHRSFRQLAILLGKRGYPVMRFDYFATGDSAGLCEEASIHQWVEDIHTASEEFRYLANIETVSLVGLRLGAALAAKASERQGAFNRVVLWDPVLSGQQYCDEIVDYIRYQQKLKVLPDFSGDFYMNGFPLLKSFRQEMASLLNLDQCDQYQANRYLLFNSSEQPHFLKLKSHFEQLKLNFESHFAQSPGNWNFVDNFGGVLIPNAIIQAIVQSFNS